ncbi:MAG: hypothetical protein JW715_07080 [Sedimentisphaerales bacterium]|nr:hypothetical protein [Sedimentisphaerales bacterium]
MSKHIHVLFLLLCCCLPADALENLAFNKRYIFSPEPGYPLCTDASDALQLTDGGKYGSQWTSISTVGWRRPEPAVEIVIDLGQKYVVDEVRIHTVGGGVASVEFPEFAAVLLSDDGRLFKFAGLISGKEFANVRGFGYRGVSRTMTINEINAAGRYVKIVMRPNGLTLFTDEVEVLGEFLSDAVNRKLRDNLDVYTSHEELLSRIDDYLQLQETINITSEAVRQTRLKYMNRAQGSSLDDLQIPSQEISLPKGRVYTPGEIKQIKGKIGKIKSEIYELEYDKPFVCLPANPMDIVYEKKMHRRENADRISVQMWQNEYESAAFDIINCSETPLEMMVSISPLVGPGTRRIDSGETITIRRAVYVKASGIGSIADALVLQNERPFTLEPGGLAQIWLTIYNPQMTAGSYEGKIAVAAKTQDSENPPLETIPIVIKVGSNKFPEKVALKTCNWAYYEIASATEMAEDLRRHHTNVYVVPAQDLPFLRFSSDPPGVIRKPNFAALDETLERHKYAGTFLIGLNFSVKDKDFGRFGDVEWMTPAWKNVFTTWLKDLVAHLKERRIGYERFVLYPFDESIADEYFELAVLIKAVDPKIRLYANSFGKGPEEFMRFRGLIDVWCLQDSHCMRHPDWFETIKGFGTELWTYECLRPMKAKQPHSYYRLLPWRAFKRGQTGAGIWIYYYGLGFKPGAVPWDDTLRPHGFSGVVYGAKASPVGSPGENIVPSRRWESWREGVEDYQYLIELQRAIERMKIKDPKAAADAQRILDEQVDSVLKNQDDGSLVYTAREILSATLQLLTRATD